MADATHGYAVGCQGTYDDTEHCTGNGVVYRTGDGTNWSLLQTFSGDLTGVDVRGVDDIFVSAWNGDIWHYSSSPTAVTLATARATTANPNLGLFLAAALLIGLVSGAARWVRRIS